MSKNKNSQHSDETKLNSLSWEKNGSLNHSSLKSNATITLLHLPWTEKYRPIKIEDLVVPPLVKTKIMKFLKDHELPHLIITGVPGIGKTTTIGCLAKLLLGPYYKIGVLELNASDDRGVKAVQSSIAGFCHKSLIFIKEDEGKYCKHKIVLLDEADNITQKAQYLISILIEKYGETTKFVFTCNTINDIVETIQSKCDILRYNRIPNEQIIERLKYICQQEKVKYDDIGLKTIVMTCQGDLRNAINTLQSTYQSYQIITKKHVYQLCDKPSPLLVAKILVYAREKKLKKSIEHAHELLEKGYSIHDVVTNMIDILRYKEYQEIGFQKEIDKIYCFQCIGELCYVINSGVSTSLQLDACLARISQFKKND